MITNESFVVEVLKYLHKEFKDELFIGCEAVRYTRRIPYLVSEVSLRELDHISSVFHGAVSFAIANAGTGEGSFLRSHYERQNLLDDQMTWPVLKILEDIRREPFTATGLREHMVTRKPFVLLDLDLKENVEILTDAGILPQEVLSGTLPIGKYFEEISNEERLNIAKAVFQVDAVIELMKPNAVIFSGGGLHIWHSLPLNLTLTEEYFGRLFDSITERYHEHFPKFKFDVMCRQNHKYMRLPGFKNLKYNPAARVDLLYYNDNLSEVSICVKEAMATLPDPSTFTASARSKYSGKAVALRPSALDDSEGSNFYEKVGRIRHRTALAGMKDLHRDKRLAQFVKDNLTMHAIFKYFQIPYRPVNDANSYLKVCSPLREDRNPSFSFNDETHTYRDLARDDVAGDYGDLIRRLLDRFKAQPAIDLQHRVPSTIYEAQVHCVVIAYIKYCLDRGLYNPAFPFMLKKQKGPVASEEEETPEEAAEAAGSGSGPNVVEPGKGKDKGPKKPEKIPPIPGRTYYDELLKLVDKTLEIFNKAHGTDSRNKRSDLKITLRNAIDSIPPVYYFYEYDPFRGESVTVGGNSAIALCVIYIFQMLRPVIRAIKSEHSARFEIYIEKDKIHYPWAAHYPYTPNMQKTADMSARIAQLVGVLNMTHLKTPPGTPTLIQRITAAATFLQRLDEDLEMEALHVTDIDEEFVKNAISRIIYREFKVHINPNDFLVSFVDSTRWIAFKNGFVIYDSTDSSRIGTFEPYSLEKANQLMRTGIVDLRLPFDYRPDAPTPMFDGFLDFLTDRKTDNNADKIIKYLLGSMLYPPDGTSRAVLLYGNFGMNGKSALADIIAGLLTDTYVQKKDIHRLAGRDSKCDPERAQLIDKILNISLDTPGGRIEEYFKGLIVGESLPARRLWENPHDMKFRAHHLINMNSLPSMGGGDAMPIKRRFLTVVLSKEVAIKDADTELAAKIVSRESGGIWPKIIKEARLYHEKGIRGFLTPEDILINESILLEQSAVFRFVRDFVKIGDRNRPMTKTEFRRFFNIYRRTMVQSEYKTDGFTSEVEAHLKNKFKKPDGSGSWEPSEDPNVPPEDHPEIPGEVWDRGFNYRNQKARGLPIRIFIPQEHTKSREIDSYEPMK